MKIISIIPLILVVFFSTPLSLQAQSFTISNDSANATVDISGNFNDADIHLTAVKKQPEFPGGKKAWQDFLRTNIDIKVPFQNKAIPGTYKVMIWFIVTNKGQLSTIGADTNCGYGMEAEVIRCIKNSKAWIPAETTSGKKVSFTLRTQVIFIVKQNDVVISF